MQRAIATLYQSEFLADYTLVLVDEDAAQHSSCGSSSVESTAPEEEQAFVVHGILLGVSSEYFRLRIQDPLGSEQLAAGPTAGTRRRLEIKVRSACSPSGGHPCTVQGQAAWA